MATELEVAYVQVLPSFRGFGQEVERGIQREAGRFTSAGRRAGQDWAKGFGTGSQVSPSAVRPAAAGAQVGAGFAASEAQAGQAGADTAAAFAAGLSSKGAAVSAAGTALTTGVTVPLAAVGLLSTRASIGFESAFAGVRKTVDATEGEFDRLSTSIRDTANEIPVTREELSKITELGGQLQVPNEDLEGFTRTIADLGVTTNLTTEDGALMAAQFAAITQMPTSDFDRWGATVVHLGNNLSTTEDKIVEFGLRLAGSGKQIGLSADEILAFSGALASVGINPEAGGTAFSRVFTRISDAVQTGNSDLQAFADTAGMTTDEFERMYRSNPAGLINEFVKGLGQTAASGSTTPLLEELSLIDVRIKDSLTRLAGSNDQLGKAQRLAAEGWRENTALTAEAEKRYETTDSQLEILKNRVGDVGVELGAAFLPAINSAVDGLDPLIEGVGTAAEVFGKLPDGVQQTVIVAGLLTAAAGPAAAVVGRVTSALGSVAAYSPAAAAGMSSVAAATTTATTAQEAYNHAAAVGQRTGTHVPTGPAGGSAASTLGMVGLPSLTAELAAAAGAVFLTTKGIDGITKWSQQAERAADDLIDKLAEGKDARDEFLAAVDNRPSNWNPFDTAALAQVFRGNAALPGVDGDVEYRDIDRAIKDVGKNGSEALMELRRQLVEQRTEVAATTDEYEGLSYAIRQIDAERGVERPDPAELGLSTGASIAAENERNQKALEAGADGALRYAAAIRPANTETEKFTESLAKVQARAQLSTVGIDALSAAADSYTASIERAGSQDNLLGAALQSGSAIGDLRDSTRAAVTQRALAESSTDAANASDLLEQAVSRSSLSLRANAVASDAAATGADAFVQSLERSTALDDQIGSTLTLSDAYEKFRRSAKRLPGEISVGANALDQKLRPRQRDATRNMLELADATRAYLATLVRSGDSSSKVRYEAGRLAARYRDQLLAAGLTRAEVERYVEVLGLTPAQVETAIRLSGDEQARAKLDAYISLLQGRIPGELATSVIARVETGDIEGAAQQLARFAASNPIDLPVSAGGGGDQLANIESQILEIPQAWDIATAALGGYSDAQTRGLEAVMAAGDSAHQVIAEFIRAGDWDGARTAAASFRGELEKVLGSYGVAGAAADTYIGDLLQLDEMDVETSIRLAGIDEAFTQIQLYQDLLKALDIGIPTDVAKLIATNLQDKNYGGVSTILEQFTAGELGIPLSVDTTAADATMDYFRQTEQGDYVEITADAATALAAQGVQVFRETEAGKEPVPVQIGVDTNPAATGVQAFRDYVSSQGPIFIPITAGISPTQLWPSLTQPSSPTGPFGVKIPNRGGAGGADGDPLTWWADGGLITGPGSATSDSILARLSDGEFVMRASAVRSLGIDFLSHLNQRGQIPGRAAGGYVGTTAPPAAGGRRGDFNYTVVEAIARPKPEDLLRVTRTADFLGGFDSPQLANR